MKKLFNKAIKILLITNGFILIAGAMLGPIYALFVKKIGGDQLRNQIEESGKNQNKTGQIINQ